MIFAQGDDGRCRFLYQEGQGQSHRLSTEGKEAVVAILGEDEFLGEGCLTGQPKRLTTATAMTECVMMRVEKSEIQRLLISDEPVIFRNVYLAYFGPERPG